MKADYGTHDDGCDKCEYDFYRLTDRLIKDVQKLELRTVHLRYLLSGYLPEYDGKMLRGEIFSDLSGAYYEEPAYQKYVSNYCNRHDPMECVVFNKRLKKISIGEEEFDL